ncbi:hypothetical protein CORC01_06440 [Colletotrichum orchidophilum]|uniref:Rhodopsin domain-containing protein n=1 Tax=Colletotrichum orchidophilum TaxID=1209926 RepID=A0A1G4BA15_9PEZI|nr:uncharacterized protein CORC01_06440 [Colletotrichum orchidophilum]OHE98243.1 hypothetical protein CORC01_06440 [Colletotrichum orchidophilum]
MVDDRGTKLLAVTWTLCVASATLLSLRIYCKLWRGRGLWWDDHLLIISMVSLVISISINSYIVSLGFGRHIDTISSDNIKLINLNTILVATFGIIATTTSKSSFALTLYRIVTNQWMKYLLIFIIISINISMNLVWIFGFAKCTPLRRVWDSSVPGSCWDKKKLVKFQLFAAYYSAILDFVLAILPWPILMGATMLRRERLGVAVAMSLGAIAGICGIVKAVLVVHMTSPDITYERVDLTIWTLTEPAASIMAVSIPVLRMLYRELRSTQRSYAQNKSQSRALDTGTRKEVRSTKRYGPGSQYGRNSVVVMSTGGWQESQEALQDAEGGQASPLPGMNGIIKTEEVRVRHERLTGLSEGESSIELDSLKDVHRS